MSNYTLDLSSCELYHHGVKGQKHGVRNYQYKDGSLTPEGYIHYGYGKRNKKGDIVLTRTGKAYEERRKSGIDVSSRMVGEAREQRNAVNTVAPTLRYTNELALQTTEKAKKLSASRVLGSSAAGSAAALVTTVLTANPLLGGAAGVLIGGATRSSILDKQVDKTAELKALRDKGMHHLLDLKSDSMVKDKEYTDLMKLYKAKKNYIQGGGSEEFARNITDPNKVKLDNQGRVTNVSMNLTPYRKQKKNVKHSAILDLSSGELYHYGTQGMKWGVRRYQNPDGTLTAEGYVHYGRKARGSDIKGKALGILGTAAVGSAIASNIKRNVTNAVKVKNATMKVAELGKELNSSRQKLQKTQKELKAATFITGKNPKLARKVNSLIRTTNTNTTKLNSAISARDATIAAAKAVAGLTVGEKAALVIGGAAVLAGLGYIGYSAYNKAKIRNSARLEEQMKENVQHSAILDLSSGELYHWGILGMKWGQRRWQNKDGSLTPEGEIHYGRLKRKERKKQIKLDKKLARLEVKKAKKLAKIEKSKKKKSIISQVINSKLPKKESDDKQSKKEKAADKVAKMLDPNNETKQKVKEKNISKKDFDNVAKIIEYGEKRTHNSLDQFYKDKYVLDAHKKLQTKKFKQMSNKELTDYINRYETETRFMGAKEKRSIYDINSRTLKRVATDVGSVITIAVGIKAIHAILKDKD